MTIDRPDLVFTRQKNSISNSVLGISRHFIPANREAGSRSRSERSKFIDKGFAGQAPGHDADQGEAYFSIDDPAWREMLIRADTSTPYFGPEFPRSTIDNGAVIQKTSRNNVKGHLEGQSACINPRQRANRGQKGPGSVVAKRFVSPYKFVPAGEEIHAWREPSTHLYLLIEGWAYQYQMLRDGRGWRDCTSACQDLIRSTDTPHALWYIIPAEGMQGGLKAPQIVKNLF